MQKYRNRKTVIDGILFDSKRESERYSELKLLEKAGCINELELQPKFRLLEPFRHDGKLQRAIDYIADFKYFDVDSDSYIVEDVKGMETKEFKIKKKLFLSKYGNMYEFKIVK